jgi:hypothetical protein
LLFSKSDLVPQRKGLFYLMQKRLHEIIFECVLTAFNGSNYDNYLISNSLIIIQSKLKQKVKFFKKGSSLSSILLLHNENLVMFNNIYNKDMKKKQTYLKNKWVSKLYIKDIRNLVAANMTLDNIGKLFNLDVPKLCFPYEKATSIKILKTIKSLYPYNDEFWKDSFSNKTVTVDTRLQAQLIFHKKKFTNLYEYSTHYLIQDCLLLHSIVLTLFKAYLNDSINIFIRRNYSQSSLAYQQFFIIEPSKQVNKVLAPREINNVFYNYLIKQAVTGGLCTSFVHGALDKNTPINDHFNYLDVPQLDPLRWPNFHNLSSQWQKQFHESPSGISTIDIRSLYPSASLKKLPVHIPLFFTRFTKQDHESLSEKFYNTLNINLYCNNVRLLNDTHSDVFRLVSKPPRFQNEFYALLHYVSQLPQDIKILRFQSNFTALGQLTFVTFPIDGFLSYLNLSDNKIYIKIIQYHSVFFHGHKSTCYIVNSSTELEAFKKTQVVKDEIIKYINHYLCHFQSFLVPIHFEYVELFDCDFKNHKVPNRKNFMVPYKSLYTYDTFLQAIYRKSLTGLLVVRNLEIKKNNQNPIFGFVIQRVEYDTTKLSPYTQNLLTRSNKARRVVSLHKSKEFIVISTEYFNWLNEHFGFENPPDIFHALIFQTDNYLESILKIKLNERKELKTLIKFESNPEIKQKFEIKAELIKLMLNSCYGYTLCNLSSQKFKQIENRRQFPKNLKNIRSCYKFQDNIFICEFKKKSQEPFQTLLGHVGCYILFNSKIILLKRLYYLLKYLNPKLAQLLYMDTDSAHFLMKHPQFIDNVDPNLQQEFNQQFNTHFDSGNKISGIWVEEGFFTNAEYLGEKCYRLYNDNNDTVITHMKGLNKHFQTQFHQQNIDPKKLSHIAFNRFFKTPDFIIFKTHMSKNIFTNFIPNKRYFICASGSLPLKL